MNTSLRTQVDFIIDCVRKGEKRRVVLAKFNKKWPGLTSRTFDRRLRIAEAELSKHHARVKAKAEELIVDESEKLKSKIITALERQIILTQIANGEIEIPTKEAKWDNDQKKFVLLPYNELPSHAVRIQAIKELNQMDGSYAPEKKDITTGGKPINQIPEAIASATFKELESIVKGKNNQISKD